jgi:tetratricopeptide (TPR) repeat protein
MTTSNEQEYEDVFKYAFALGFSRHLHTVSAQLHNLINSQVNTMESVLLEYKLKDLEVITKYAFEPYIDELRNAINPENTLFVKLNTLLLGPDPTLYDPTLYDVPMKLTTASIIDEIDHFDGSNIISEKSEREEELSTRFFQVLTQVLAVSEKFQIANLSAETLVSVYAVSFINEIVSHIPSTSEMQLLVGERVPSVMVLLANGMNPKTSLDQVYDQFKSYLESYMSLLEHQFEEGNNYEVIVLKLREQGNSLMSNMAFAQAIKVYTQAVDIATPRIKSEVPQLLTNRAIAYIGLNCFPEAITDLNQSVDLDWSFTPAWAQLGYCHLYMGNSLLALKSYLMALKTAIGEVTPKSFPPSEISQYKTLKMKSVLPQFVQRLCLAISLTERRAGQQNENPANVKKVIGEVRRILVALRANAVDEDERQYFTYVPQLRDSNLRNHSERANRSRPNILTQDVSQNMLASNGMESVTVTATPFERRRSENAPNPPEFNGSDAVSTAASVAAAAARAAGAVAIPPNTTTPRTTVVRRVLSNGSEPNRTSSIRELMNEVGDLLVERNNRANFLGTQTPAATTAPETSNDTPETRSEPRNENLLSDVLRGVIPAGINSVISRH